MKTIAKSVIALVVLYGLMFGPLYLLDTAANAQDGKLGPAGSGGSVKGGKVEIVPIDGEDISAVNTGRPPIKGGLMTKGAPQALQPEIGTDQGEESEGNNTIATADGLTGAEGKIKGRVYPNGDIDYYSFSATAGDKVFAGVITSFSASASTDSFLEIRDAADTVLEADNDDGSFAAASSGIAGFTIPSTGTYYFRVRHNSATAQLRPYTLYYAIRSGAATPETESNNTTATANPLAASGWMSGSVNPAADADFYSVALNAGDTMFLSLDIDPERDNVQWNGRLGMGLFGTGATQILVVNDTSVGSVANPLSETFALTVKDAGTYFLYVDEPAGGGAATNTYQLSATVIPAGSPAGCTTYTSTDVPQVIPTGPGSVSSNLTIPATPNVIRKASVFIDLNHTFMQDLDVHLRTPAGNDNGLFTDVGAAVTGGPQTTMNWWIDDDAATPPSFALSATMRHQPELNYRMDWLKGENPSGTWTLDLRDDATGDGGNLVAWSIEICEEPAPSGNLIYSEDFEANNGGFTHSGTQDEWEYGTPATTATTTSPPRAAFLNCNSGTNCWKTDLDDGYNASSSQDLVSPNLNLTAYLGTVNLYWSMRYQMESASFDHAWVQVTDVNNPADTRRVWEWDAATMSNAPGNPIVNIAASAGWGRYSANVSDFIGKVIQVTFHVDSDTTVQMGGMAIDDVQLRHIGATAANVPVGGRVLSASGNPVSRALVVLTDDRGATREVYTSPFGFYMFDNVASGRTYTLTASRKGFIFNPVVVTVGDEITGLDISALP